VFAAIAGFAADLATHGVPVIAVDGTVRTYPLNAMPDDHQGWLPTLIVAVLASIAAFASAAYANVGALRAVRTRPTVSPQ